MAIWKSAAVGLALALAVHGPASAQMSPPDIPFMAFYDHQGTYAATLGVGTPATEALSATRPDLRAVGRPVLPERSLRFRHDGAVLDRVRDEVAERFAAEDPARAATIRDEFRRADVVGEFRDMIARYGYDPDNLAHAMAAFLILQWEVVSGGTADAAQMDGAARQVADALRASSVIQRMSDADKQAVADSLAYQAILSVVVRQHLERSGDAGGIERLRAGIVRGARALGWDFERVTLTAQGFRAPH